MPRWQMRKAAHATAIEPNNCFQGVLHGFYVFGHSSIACGGAHGCVAAGRMRKQREDASMTTRKLNRQDLRDAAEKYKNWGKWGPDDEIGTLNYTQPEDIVAAAKLVKKGKVISLALNYDEKGPQGAKTNYPSLGRINPLHVMLRTGTDAYSGVLDKRGIRAADDMVVLPLQSGTQWDGLGHVFYENYMWNGYDCREVTSFGAQKCGIEKTKNKMVGRGVFLDVARYKGVEWLEDGYAITCDDLDNDRQEAGRRLQARRLHRRAHRPARALPAAKEAGTAIPAATHRAWRSRRWNSCSARSSPRSPPTPGAPRCVPTRPSPASTSPGTGSPSRSWA